MRVESRIAIGVIAVVVSVWTVASASAAPAARAEPCTGPADRAVATRAARELSSRARMIVFCEACGDAAPGRPIGVAAVALHPTGAGLADVLVDGRPIDLATTYVQTSDVEYRNLAALAGCDATGSSPVLRIDRATATGVLIRAAGAPPAAPPPPIAGAAPSSPPAPPGWLAGFLGGLAAFATASLLGVVAAVTRRRRRRGSSLPRAASLLDRQARAPARGAADAREDGQR